MKNNVFAFVIGYGLVFATASMADGMTKQSYQQHIKAIHAQFLVDEKQCDLINWNDNKVCLVEAEGNERIAMAELAAIYQSSDKNQYEVGRVKSNVRYLVSIATCKGLAIDERQDCIVRADEINSREISELIE